MTVNSVDIHLNAFANFSPVFAEVAKLKASMAEMQSSSFGSTLSSDYVKGLQGAQQQFTKLVDSTRAFNIQNVQMADSTAQFSKQLEAGQLKLGQYFNIAKQAAKGVSTELDNLATQQARIARSVVIPDALHSGYAQVITDLNGTVAATEKATLYQTAYNTVLRDGANKLIDFGKNMQWAGRQLTVGLTVPLALFASQAAKSYLAFDQQMTDMLKVYGSQAVVQSQQALDTIRTQVTSLATDLAHTIGVTMTDTVTIAQTFSQMGLTGQDLLKTTQATAGLMKLGGLTAAGSAQAAIAMQNVFKLQSNQMTDAINFLNAAKHSTSTSMQDIVDALPKVGPIITQLGGSYKDFATMLVALRENGVPASQAANTIKSMFATLVNPTTKAISEFNNLGISLKGIVSQDANNPLKMLTDLQTALDKLPSQQRTKAIEELFGKFQFARADALISSLGAAGSQNAKVMQLYGDTSAQLAAVAAQEIQVSSSGTPAAQYNKMKASLQADLIPVGQSFLQVMTKIGNAIDKIVQGFNHLGSFKTVIFGGLAFAALIGPIVMFGGLFANLIGNILKGANYARMFKEGFAQATNVNPIERFGAGLKNLSNFYKEVDVSTLAASHSSDLMTLSAENSTKAFSILGLAIESLAKAIAGLNAVAFNPVGNISAIQDTVTSAGAAAETAFATLNLERPMMLATGGYVPGEGNSDSQPALLTPGEAVIPKDKARKYAPFINAMLNGNLPQHEEGKQGVQVEENPTNYTHISTILGSNEKGKISTYVRQSVSQASAAFEEMQNSGQKVSTKWMGFFRALSLAEEKLGKGLMDIRLYGGLGVTLPRQTNLDMSKGGASKSQLLEDWTAGGTDKWREAAGHAGIKTEEQWQKVLPDIKLLDDSIKRQIESLSEDTKITDDMVSKMYVQTHTIDELQNSETGLIKAFDLLSQRVAEMRTTVLTPEGVNAKTGGAGFLQNLGFKQSRNKKGLIDNQVDIFDENGVGLGVRPVGQSQKTKATGPIMPPEMRAANIEQFIKDQTPGAEAMASNLGLSISDGIVSGIIEGYPKISDALSSVVKKSVVSGKAAEESASPSKLFARMMGLPIPQGIAAGITEGTPAVVAATEEMALASKTAIAEQPMLPAMSLIDWKGLTVPKTKMGNTNPADINAWQSAGDQQMLPGMAGFSERAMTQEQKDSQKALADIANNTEETGKVAKESKGMGMMGKMGGMMALSMIAPMAINALPGGSNNALKTTASDVTQFAGMGMMFGPGGAAAGAAAGALAGILSQVGKAQDAAFNKQQQSLNASASSITAFGGHVSDLKPKITDFGTVVSTTGGIIAATYGNLDPKIKSLITALGNLPSSDNLSKTIQTISNSSMSTKDVASNLQSQFADMQFQAGGSMDPTTLKNLVQASLIKANRGSDFASVWKQIGPSLSGGLKSATSADVKAQFAALSKTGLDVTGGHSSEFGTTGAGSLFNPDRLARRSTTNTNKGGFWGEVKNFIPQAVYSMTGTSTFGWKSDIEMQDKAMAAAKPKILQYFAAFTSGSNGLQQAKDSLTGVSQGFKDSTTELGIFTAAAKNENGKVPAGIKAVNDAIKAVGGASKISKAQMLELLAVGNDTSVVPKGFKTMKEYLQSLTKDSKALGKAYEDALKASGQTLDANSTTTTTPPTTPPTTPTAIDYTKMYAPTIKHYTDLKKLIDDQATAQKKYNDQLKATQDYQSKQMDYFNQAKNALTSGNYLGAAQAQQDALSNQADFAGTMQANKTNDQSAAIGNIISALNDAASNSVSLAKAAKYEGMSFQTSKFSTKFDNSLLGGQSKAQLNASTHSMNAQALAAASAAQQLTHGDPFSGVTINQNVSIDGSVITPNELIAQLHAHAAATAAALAEKIKQKTAASHKVGKSGASSSRVPTAPKMPKVGK